MPLSVQQNTGLKTGSNVATANGSFVTLPQNGAAVLVLISAWNAGDLTFVAGNVTDNQGNAYTLDKTIFNNTGHGAAAIFRCPRIGNPGGTFTVTVASSKGSANFFDFCMLEVRGFNGRLNLDNAASNTGGAPSSPSTGSIAAIGDSNLLVMVHEIASNEGSLVAEVTSPVWTQAFEQLSFAANSPGEADYKLVNPGTYGGNWTAGTVAQFAALIASYSSQGGPPAQPAPLVGVPTVLTGNVVYSTPPRVVNIEILSTGAAILEGSLDAITWATIASLGGAGMTLASGVVAPYIRPSVDITVILRKAKSKL